ncbi:hypothetical protein PVA44_00295 [Entomospira nematocerorum]|uniref:Uncharacterized protein n=1 Tax=Entomospira nematocerorum TaxID=2719987 RepID=A0A968KTL7_9SPIO|nr:hypothetical protein [Entomospira nematocera]NIZ47521.1 hypothetical protein [Entomospira nematocera]WDI33939.1 hypothetical protein PVA44_00295 [Entomospira nematocera]
MSLVLLLLAQFKYLIPLKQQLSHRFFIIFPQSRASRNSLFVDLEPKVKEEIKSILQSEPDLQQLYSYFSILRIIAHLLLSGFFVIYIFIWLQ